MGLFSLFKGNLKDPVRGVAQVVSASAYAGRGMWQNCHLPLVVQADGVEPFRADWDGLVRSSRWPFPGISLPVDVDRANPGRYEILWKEVDSHRDSAEQKADAIVASLRGEGGASSGLEDVPPEAAAIVEQITEMFPGATVMVNEPIDLRGGAAEGGDDRVSQLERLAKLHERGDLTDAEFEVEKSRILGGD